MLCALICIHEWHHQQFNDDSERQIFLINISWHVYLLPDFLPEIYWEEIAEEIFFFHISFLSLTWDMNPGFPFNKPTYYLLDYKHNWSLQPFSQVYWRSFSHHLRCVCVNFIYKWRDLKSTPNYRFFEKYFIAGLFTPRVFNRNLLRGNRRRNIFYFSYFVLISDLGYESRLSV